MNEKERVESSNAKVREALAAGKAGRGYAVVGIGGSKLHAARGTINGWGGYVHPRALCQPHSPRTYAYVVEAQDAEVTCQRCRAGLAKRGLAG